MDYDSEDTEMGIDSDSPKQLASDVNSEEEESVSELEVENSLEEKEGSSNVDSEDENDSIASDGEISDRDEEEVSTQSERNSEECAIYSKESQSVIQDVEKGNAIRQQYEVWESLLECRIKLQKCLAAANRLPQKNTFVSLKSKLPRRDQNNMSRTCRNLSQVLQSLLDLQKEMHSRYPEFRIPGQDGSKKRVPNAEIDFDIDDDCDINDDESISSSIASGNETDRDKANSSDSNDDDEEEKEDEDEEQTSEPPKKIKKLEDYSKELKKQSETFLTARNEAIQKWNDRTRVSSGRVNSSNFSAFDQSTLKQIENILCDKERLIKRTQTKRSVYSILGSSDDNEKTNELTQLAECDPEIFDDDDFYHKILRDLIEQRSADVTNPHKLGRQWIELQKVRSKMKRNIDVKSTKGRRLRYTVHQKLVNFMAPIPYHLWTEDAESELYSSLFGKLKQQ